MRTIDEWYNTIDFLCAGTRYEPILNGGHGGSRGVAIVPREKSGPQRICVYPRKTKNASIAVEMDVYELATSTGLLEGFCRIKGNRPHYSDLDDMVILNVICLFLLKK